MKVLLDECLPRKLKNELSGHEVTTVTEMKWSGIKNGRLIQLAETSFEVFVTADQNIPQQQNLTSTTLAIVILIAPNNRLETLRPLASKLLKELQTIHPGDLTYIQP